jgi:AcrR family transcriptional regulator
MAGEPGTLAGAPPAVEIGNDPGVDPVPEPPQARRARATRAALLAGARDVFVARGFEGATIAEIVARSGTSVGSLYNQFGGKENLFLELHREHCDLLWEATHLAMRRARHGGADDPFEVYLVGARAYLVTCWDVREPARLFLSGAGPPGFDAVTRGGLRRWISQNAGLLQVADQPFGEALAAAVTGVMAAGARQVVECASREDAVRMTDYFTALVARLAGPQPGAPAP